jgi:CHASE2 domain-containing sensor protein
MTMLHLLLDKRPWFEAGGRAWCPRTISREGHMLAVVFGLLLIGIHVLLYKDRIALAPAIIAIVAVTIWFMLIVRHKTARAVRR